MIFMDSSFRWSDKEIIFSCYGNNFKLNIAKTIAEVKIR